MTTVTLSVPEESMFALGGEEESFRRKLLLSAAMMCFEQGELSSGAAAQLAGLPKPVFLNRLTEYGLYNINLTPEDIDSEATID